jgi:O-antigen/teichoic acid export membrane protein
VLVTTGLGLFITPLIARGLGQAIYGIWAMIQQSLGYVQLANLRATATIKVTLAARTHDPDPTYMRQQVGAALKVLVRVSVIVSLVGAIALWVGPEVMHVPAGYTTPFRWALAIGTLGIIFGEFSSIPGNVLRGMNIEYKQMGIAAIASASSSGLSLMAVSLGWGLPGLAVAAIIADFLVGANRLYVARKHVPWFGAEAPPPEMMRVFFRQTIWLSLASFGFVLQNGSDVLVGGIVLGARSAATLTATSAGIGFVTSAAYSLLGAALPGIAALSGQKAWNRLSTARNELHLFLLVITAVVGSVTIVVNGAFVPLWIGPTYYGGAYLTVMLVAIAIADVPLRLDALLLDSLLRFKERAILTIATSLAGFALGAVMARYAGLAGFEAGLLAMDLVATGTIISLVHANSQLLFRDYARWMARPLCASAVLVGVAFFLRVERRSLLAFLGIAAISSIIAAAFMWLVGLGPQHRQAFKTRFGSQVRAAMRYIRRSDVPLGPRSP